MKITKFDYSRILISSIFLLCTTIFISGISYDVNYAEAELPTSPCSYLDAGKEGTRYVKISYDEITKKDFCQNTWDYFHDITESDCNAGKYVNYCRVPQVCQHEAGRVETDPDCKPKLKPTPLSETPALYVPLAIVLTLPEDIVVESDNTNGARVEWVATAVDELGNPVEVVCDPKTTTIFPIGDRTVTCRATLYDAETGEVIEFIEKMFNVNVWTDAKGTIITDLIPKLPPVP